MKILSNQDIESVCTMKDCIQALYEGIKSYSHGDAVRRPRMDLFAPTSRKEEYSCFSTMDGLIRNGYYALRVKPDIMSWPVKDGVQRRETYCYKPGLYGGLILLFKAENAELVSIMNDGYIQHMRVGAMAALGAKYLSRENAETVGILGSGGMARTFAIGFSSVRNIKRIKAYSPTRNNLEKYCKEMSEKLQIHVEPMDDPESAIKGSDIVASCTNALKPVIKGDWLEPGMYVATVTGWELDHGARQKISLIGQFLDRKPLDISQFKDDNFDIGLNCMAYIGGQPEERQFIPRRPKQLNEEINVPIVQCVDWTTETPIGRQTDEDITVLKELSSISRTNGTSSDGIQGLQFAAVAGRAYELAEAKGLGKELPFELFLQDIPT
jgi:alanine dehydrogenase